MRLITWQLKWQDILGQPVVTILLVLKVHSYWISFHISLSFHKKEKNNFTKCVPVEDSLEYFIQACVARVCMKYTSCLCMLTICSYQYLTGIISMYWKVRSAWAWFKIKWIFSKKKPNNNQPQCIFKDLIDSKDECECKNGIFTLGWSKGSLNKDLEHLCFWSSSLRPGQEESCYLCMLSNAKNTLPNPGTTWSELNGRNAWVT